MAKKQINAQMRLTADTRDFQTKMKDANRSVDDFRKSSAKGLPKVAKGFSSIAAAAAAAGTAITTVNKAIQEALRLADVADTMATQSLDPRYRGRIEAAAALTSQDPSSVIQFGKSLSKNVGLAQLGRGRLKDLLPATGLTADELAGLNQYDMMMRFSNVVGRMPVHQRNALLEAAGGGLAAQTTLQRIQAMSADELVRADASSNLRALGTEQQFRENYGQGRNLWRESWQFLSEQIAAEINRKAGGIDVITSGGTSPGFDERRIQQQQLDALQGIHNTVKNPGAFSP